MQKVVLVTGAAGNLGKAVSDKMIGNGYHVTGIVSPRTPSEFVHSTNMEIFQADLGDESSIREILQRIFDKYPVIDGAVLTAGGFSMGNLRKTGKNELDKMFRKNFESAYFTAREVFQKMEEQGTGGRIFFIGAKPALIPSAGKKSIAYSLSKSLLFGLSDLINEEGNKKDIHSTVIVPSIIDSPANRESMPDADFSKWVTPEVIAENISFLLSDAGRSQRQPVIRIFGES